jgi:ferritin-like metal-binding protein YciE
MSQLTTPEELFTHELQDLYYAEQKLTKVLPKLAAEVSDAELAEAFEDHLEETRQHVANLEQVFDELGVPARGERCPGIEGIAEEHDVFVSENEASEDVLDMFVTGAAARAEHYEIAAYTGLVGMADTLGETRAKELLEENLKQEKKALEKVESISKRLLQEKVTA